MRLIAAFLTCSCVLIAGCADQSAQPNSEEGLGDMMVSGVPTQFSDPREAGGSAPVPIESGVVTLTPENSKIEFVGTHVGEPNPRTGGFERFSGKLQVDEATSALNSVSVEIDTTSLWTQIERLTTHLMSGDFLEVREYPTAVFESNSVVNKGEGEFAITGELTLHGVTNEISFPATVVFADGGLTLDSAFSIKRTDFGINYGPERVVDEVSINVVVGEKTVADEDGGEQAGGGGRGGGGRRGGGRGDPAQYFARQDADGDGKLSGDEINEWMRENLEATDTDGDGAVSLEEFQERMRQRRGGGRGRGERGGGGGGGGQDRPERPQRPESESDQ